MLSRHLEAGPYLEQNLDIVDWCQSGVGNGCCCAETDCVRLYGNDLGFWVRGF